MRRALILSAGLLVALLFLSTTVLAQSDSYEPFSHVGVAVKLSTLGIGGEAAVPLSQRINLRGGFNAFNYDRTFHKDEIAYAGQLRFRSAEAHLDWFPFGGAFHLSPGVMLYNGNAINANADIAPGNTFTLNNTTYVSDAADPVSGRGKIDFIKAGPMFTVGWGNLLPRNHRRFSVPFEVGFVYTGAPRTALAFTGTACDPTGIACRSISSDPTIQANVQAERDKINKDLDPVKFYPVISVGFAVNF
jgi:hypothetical protein